MLTDRNQNMLAYNVYKWCEQVKQAHNKQVGVLYIYTVSQKKQDTKLLPITSPNVNRFSKFFH